jgi:hypothetical protein
MAPPPDPAKQRRLAELIGSGLTYAEATAAVGVSVRTGKTWMQSPTLREIAQATREAMLGLDNSNVAIIRQAKSATNKDGTPDHALRLRAIELEVRFSALTPEPDAIEPEGSIIVYPRTEEDDEPLFSDDYPANEQEDS